MVYRSALLHLASPAHQLRSLPVGGYIARRTVLTIGIETSCDDTSVAVLETVVRGKKNRAAAILHFHKKVTADNTAHQGIHPVTALESHQRNLALLLQAAIKHLPRNMPKGSSSIKPRFGSPVRRPTFISVTRGPGMRSNLFTGLDTAKGLAVAWDIPIIGVNHMAAHAMTPRLASELSKYGGPVPEPEYPFLSLLVSGGHSLIVLSKSTFQHRVLVETSDTAIGDTLDKIARLVLPKRVIELSEDTMYGRLLEAFAFPNGADDYNYSPPKNRGEEINKRPTKWGWAYQPPLGESQGGRDTSALSMSFTGLLTWTERILTFQWDKENNKLSKNPRDVVSDEERRDMAREAMRVGFEHLATRTVLALRYIQTNSPEDFERIKTVVVSGGVASNQYLKHLLQSFLAARGFPDLQLVSPPIDLCTDNAAMIAWAGVEMYRAGYRNTPLTSLALRKWSLEDVQLQKENKASENQ